MKFKKGDKVRCIQPAYRLTENRVYTIDGYGDESEGFGFGDLVKLKEVPYSQNVNNLWFQYRFELVEAYNPTPSFKIIEWKDWVNDTTNRIEKAINDGSLSIFFVVTASKLDMDDLNPFCKEYCCEGVYESNVFVKHHSEKDCYWYVSNEATLIYKPKLN
jgi:hypothetical protein